MYRVIPVYYKQLLEKSSALAGLLFFTLSEVTVKQALFYL